MVLDVIMCLDSIKNQIELVYWIMVIFGANHDYVMLFDLVESNQWVLDVFLDWVWLGFELGFHDEACFNSNHELNVITWIKLSDFWCWMY